MYGKAKRVLKEAYDTEIEKLRTLKPGDQDYQDSLDRMAKLNKMINEDRQSMTDCATKVVTCLGGIAISLGGLYISRNLAYDVLRFEKDDSISTFTGRTVIGNVLKFKAK